MGKTTLKNLVMAVSYQSDLMSSLMSTQLHNYIMHWHCMWEK